MKHMYIQENIFIRLYDLALTKTEKDNDGHYQTVPVFTGLFLINDSLKNINSSIRIKRNQIKIFSSNKEKVEIDNSTFEKYFDVYSDSDILAMEILTHDVMEDLVHFYNKYKIDFEIVIKGNSIYIRFNTGVMFEPNILSQEFTSTLWVYYSILKFIIDITIKINKLLRDVQI